MLGFLSGFWGKAVAIGAIVLSALGTFLMLKRSWKREGAREEREQHREIADEAQERMQQVGRSEPDDILDRMRRGGL